MKPLPLRPELALRETMPSFVSRIAAMNRVGVEDFCFDMGFSIKRMINLEAEAVSRIAQLGGLDGDASSNLLSWTGER
jgi:hypothetical protein